MDASPKSNYTNTSIYIDTGLTLLMIGMLFGLTGGMQYLVPGILKKYLSFEKVRPLHVSSVVFWIIITTTGVVLHYIQEHFHQNIRFPKLVRLQYIFHISGISCILLSYIFGIFGGREYWEFHPILALPIVIGWILFILNILGSIRSIKKQPVYIWMWIIGALFFLFTFLESYLWLIPYFSKNILKDTTLQWKSYGSMVGSWNMLIYGSGVYLMDKISGTKKYSTSSTAFIIFLLGLTNLMFNWGHHIYTVPTFQYIKTISYIISMTELILIGRMIYQWKKALSEINKYQYLWSYRFLFAADIWVFLTLLLAILMSIPAINIYTHGTHITVAHTMGATIGINSMLLLSFIFDIGFKDNSNLNSVPTLNFGFWITQLSLFVFWISLIGAGIIKSKYQMQSLLVPYSTMMGQLKPFIISFTISGLLIFIGIVCVINTLRSYK